MNIIQKSEAFKGGLRKSFQDGSSKIAHRKRYEYEVGLDIEPEKIICYNTPFPEMQGDIVYVDYERNSWRYMNYERSFRQNDLEAFKIGGQPGTLYDTITPFLDVPVTKGGGSAYGANGNRPNLRMNG